MKKSVVIILIVLGVIVLIIAGLLFYAKQYTAPKTSNLTSQINPQGHTISIIDYAFTPSQLIISVGDTVVWMNNGQITHTVTSDSGNELNSTLSPGASYFHTFNTTGTYNYHCSIHPSMIGQVIVV